MLMVFNNYYISAMTTFTPQHIKIYFTTKQRKMPKSSSAGSKLTYARSIQKFQEKLNKNLLTILCDSCPIDFLALAVTATNFTWRRVLFL